MSLDNCPLALFPDTENCSGIAIGCIADQCICPEGTMGFGDFVSGSPACHLNVQAVQALYGLAGVLHTLGAIFAVWYLIVKPQRQRQRQTANQRLRKKKAGPFHDQGMQLGLVALFAHVTLAALGYQKLVAPNRTIGTDPGVTAAFALGTSSVWFFLPWISKTYLVLALKSLKMGKSEEEKQRILNLRNFFKKYIEIIWTGAVLAGVFPLIMLANPLDQWMMFGLACAHYVTLGVSMLTLGTVFIRSTTPIIQDLKKAQANRPDPELKAILDKVRRIRGEVERQIVVQIASAALFGCWPWLQRYASYHIALAYAGVALILPMCLHTLLPFNPNSSTNKGSSDIPGNNSFMSSPRGGQEFASSNNATSQEPRAESFVMVDSLMVSNQVEDQAS